MTAASGFTGPGQGCAYYRRQPGPRQLQDARWRSSSLYSASAVRRHAWVYEQAAMRAAYRLLPHDIEPCANSRQVSARILARPDHLRRHGALVIVPAAPSPSPAAAPAQVDPTTGSTR